MNSVLIPKQNIDRWWKLTLVMCCIALNNQSNARSWKVTSLLKTYCMLINVWMMIRKWKSNVRWCKTFKCFVIDKAVCKKHNNLSSKTNKSMMITIWEKKNNDIDAAVVDALPNSHNVNAKKLIWLLRSHGNNAESWTP